MRAKRLAKASRLQETSLSGDDIRSSSGSVFALPSRQRVLIGAQLEAARPRFADFGECPGAPIDERLGLAFGTGNRVWWEDQCFLHAGVGRVHIAINARGRSSWG